MDSNEFIEQIKSTFKYLVDDYGFSIAGARHDPGSFGNCLVKYCPGDVGVIILIDRGQVMIDFEPYPKQEKLHVSMAAVIEYLPPTIGEPVYIFPEEWDDYSIMVNGRKTRFLLQFESSVKRQFPLPKTGKGDKNGCDWPGIDFYH